MIAVELPSGSGAPATRGRAILTAASVTTAEIYSRGIAAGGAGTLGIIQEARIRDAEERMITATTRLRN